MGKGNVVPKPSLTEAVMSVLRGRAYLPETDGLSDYWAAQGVKSALLRRDAERRLSGVREALARYRVTAWLGGDGPRGIVLRADGADVLSL